MSDEPLWKTVRTRAQAQAQGKPQTRRMGSLQQSVLFSVAVLALALVMTSSLSGSGDEGEFYAQGEFSVDSIVTGSVSSMARDEPRTYVVRRSILQEMPGAECIIDERNSDGAC